MSPILSIITVTFNARAVLEETILSVLQQSFTNYEYWVIDGESNDGTIDIAKKYSNKVNLISEKDWGIYDAMNKGISKAKGQWIYFLNAGDTLFDNHVLQNIFETTIAEDVALLHGNIKTKNHPSGSDYTQGQSITLPDFYYRFWLCHQAVFTRRTAFDRIGTYNSRDYPVSADQEWFIRFLKAGGKALYINRIIAHYEVVGESFLKRTQTHSEHLKMVETHFNWWIILQNKMCSPLVRLKIYLIQNYSTSKAYMLYRRLFYRD